MIVSQNVMRTLKDTLGQSRASSGTTDLSQRRGTRNVVHFTPWRNATPRPSYHTRCLLFGLDTLARRCDNAQCTFMSKLIVGETDSPELLSRVNKNDPQLQTNKN